MERLKNITMEMSLKPFKSTEKAYVEAVCRKAFEQWKGFLDYADVVSIMLWTSDGSEILDYSGNLEEEFEWGKYIGGANPRIKIDPKTDPNGIGLHTRHYLYMDNPPIFTYKIYRELIKTIKTIGRQVTGKPIRVGATFDPGPEFAKSDFKYNRHNEICFGSSMGKGSMVCCYGILNADNHAYAAYPNGIPQDTPFGTFLGKQSQLFLKDLDFDYIWLSNGLGFGTEAWGTTGTIFDGKEFHKDKFEETQQKNLNFWDLFRAECDFRIETRGTNLTAGIDLASDGVNLKKIYEGGYDMLPPPNSPWAALDGDFGLELAGYLSRMAELPTDEEYLFRFYVHDPWWMNSPWLDRYERQPHDIYLPLSTVRLDAKGKACMPTHINLLSIDNSLGDMPDQCPQEVIPHLVDALRTSPDQASPFLWVYPFSEYSELKSGRAEKSFFEDWFIRGAINNGFPLSSVISTQHFTDLLKENKDFFNGVNPVIPMPHAGDEVNYVIIDFVKNGGQVMLYGSAEDSDPSLLELLNIKQTSCIDGKLKVSVALDEDVQYPTAMLHDKALSDGGINTVLADEKDADTQVLIEIANEKLDKRVGSVYRAKESWNEGKVIWIRGTNCSRLAGGHILTPYDTSEFYPLESTMRIFARKFGYDIKLKKHSLTSKSPVIMMSRNENAFYVSGYSPDNTVGIEMKLPLGAPLLLGHETYIEDGRATYYMPRAWHNECRVFVEQEDNGVVSCKERYSCSYFMRHRMEVPGLKNATVRILPRKGFEDRTELLLNPLNHIVVGDEIHVNRIQTKWGLVLELKNATGELIVSDEYVPLGTEVE